MATRYLACDLGAESGRLMLGTLSEGRLALEEVHRFPNVPLKVDGSLHWDILFLFEELKAGLKKAGHGRGPIASISTDGWGVDYTLFDAGGALISPTFHYRDARTARGVDRVRATVDWPTLFDETGIQFMPLNTIYQLAAESPERLARADRLLMIADAFNYLLCGEAKVEESNASTTQLYNPRTKQWSDRLITALGLPRTLFPAIVPAGAKLGTLKPELAFASGLGILDVVASCSHDTGAAVAAIPASTGTWAYVSSGTWSLMGVELASPVLSDACRELNFTNEIGFGGSVRLLKNIIGLWLVQECRRQWASEGQEFDYPKLTRMAEVSPPFVSLINPADPRFIPPGDMPAKIAGFCRETGQPVPESPGAFIRCALESLALLYCRTLRQVESLIEKKIERLHIVGGGSRNALLNQLAANALQIPVLAGPVEATAAGNILIQAIALGHVPSLAAARELVRNSFETTLVAPGDASAWEAQHCRFESFFA